MVVGMIDVASTDATIEKEIAATQKALEQQVTNTSDDNDEAPPSQRLEAISRDCSALQWKLDLERYAAVCADANDNDTERLECLAGILLERHNDNNSLYEALFSNEFAPLCEFRMERLLLQLRSALKSINYPTDIGSLLAETNDDPSSTTVLLRLKELCTQIRHVQAMRKDVLQRYANSTADDDPLVLEFCRPLAERVRFHFLETSMDRPTTTRIDRLPEWLATYVKDHILKDPLTLMELILFPNDDDDNNELLLMVLNEVVRLVQWVLTSRDCFRHPHVLASPRLLCNAVQHLLQLDAALVAIVLGVGSADRLVRLVDVCIAGDEEVLQWWLEREREGMVHTLTTTTSSSSSTTDSNCSVAARFAAVWQSATTKAALFRYQQPYETYVMVPIVNAVLDNLHHRAQAQRQKWTSARSGIPMNGAAVDILQEWMTVMDDARAVARTIRSAAATSSTEQEERLARSLERLASAMLDDCVADTVQIVCLERAQLAKYLMQCAYMLSLDLPVDDYLACQDISVDLMETQRVLCIILRCGSTIFVDRVLTALAEQLLEVALDWNGMAPELGGGGIQLFVRDVRSLFDLDVTSINYRKEERQDNVLLLPRQAQRLLQVADLLDMDQSMLEGLRDTLRALADQDEDSSGPILEEVFGSDSRLYEQALSMLQAKGVGDALDLSDVLSILNRLSIQQQFSL